MAAQLSLLSLPVAIIPVTLNRKVYIVLLKNNCSMIEPFVAKRFLLFQEETAIQRMLSTLFLYPEMEFTLSELAKQARVSKSSASRLLQMLKTAGFIHVIDKGIVFRIRSNTESFEYRKRKIAHNLMALYESNFVEYLETFFKNPVSIVLFGSFRKGDDISTSDIDIAVETLEEIKHEIVRPPKVESFEKLFNRKIEVHLFNRKKVDINVFNNIANGIVLSGFLEVRP